MSFCRLSPAVTLVLIGLAAQSCAPAQSEQASPDQEAGPVFELLAASGADTEYTYTVAVVDTLAVFGRGRELVIVAAADPSRPHLLGTLALPGDIRDVALAADAKGKFPGIVRDSSLAADAKGNFRGDVRDTALTADVAGHLPLADDSGDRRLHAYVAADTSGLHVIDLTDPSRPRAIGQTRFADRAAGVDIQDGRAFVAARSEGLRIIDISDPASPTEIGHIITPDEAVDVTVRGRYAYVAAWYESMRVVDVSEPADPVEVSFASYDSYDNGAAWSVHVDGDIAVQAVPDIGLRTVDVSDPRDVRLYKVYRGLFAPVHAAVRGRMAFVADQSAGLRILDLKDPVRPVEIGSLDVPGSAMSVTLAGDVAYVAAREGGLRIVDISRPHDPRETAYVDLLDDVVDLAEFGDAVYAAGRQNGVMAFRMAVGDTGTMPAAADAERRASNAERSVPGPSISAQHVLQRVRGLDRLARAGATQVVANGDRLLVGGRGVITAYALDGEAREVASANVPGSVHGLAASGEVVVAAIERFGIRLFAADDLRPLSAFEVDSPPLASSAIQMHRAPRAAWDVLIGDTLVYTAFDDGVRVLRIDEPSPPAALAYLETPERAYRLARHGDVLFAACDDGIRAIDIANPSSLRELAFLRTPSFATAVTWHDSRLYVGDLSGTLTITTASLETRFQAKVADRILDMLVQPSGIVLAAGADGVRVVALEETDAQ